MCYIFEILDNKTVQPCRGQQVKTIKIQTLKVGKNCILARLNMVKKFSKSDHVKTKNCAIRSVLILRTLSHVSCCTVRVSYVSV